MGETCKPDSVKVSGIPGADRLREASYDHAFVAARTEIEGVQSERAPELDMHGIALTRGEAETGHIYVTPEERQELQSERNRSWAVLDKATRRRLVSA